MSIYGYCLLALRGCDEVIDRGLGYICGRMHGGEGGCGRYFCGEHEGWAGPRGGCSHRFKGAYGATMCQPLRSDAGNVWCACGFKHYVEWPADEAVA